VRVVQGMQPQPHGPAQGLSDGVVLRGAHQQPGGCPEVELGRVRRGPHSGLRGSAGQPGGQAIPSPGLEPPAGCQAQQPAVLPQVHQAQPRPGAKLPQQALQCRALALTLPGADHGLAVADQGHRGPGPRALGVGGGEGLAVVLPYQTARQAVKTGDAHR